MRDCPRRRRHFQGAAIPPQSTRDSWALRPQLVNPCYTLLEVGVRFPELKAARAADEFVNLLMLPTPRSPSNLAAEMPPLLTLCMSLFRRMNALSALPHREFRHSASPHVEAHGVARRHAAIFPTAGLHDGKRVRSCARQVLARPHAR